MEEFQSDVTSWLAEIVGPQLSITKHTYSHQDEVYKIEAVAKNYYLKVSTSLEAERDNLNKISPYLAVPAVIDFRTIGGKDYLLINDLSGKNLAELVGNWSNLDIVRVFAEAIKAFHAIDAGKLFPDRVTSGLVLLHGDMSLPNIIATENGQLGYIDFGQMSVGAPDADLADAIWSLQRNIGPDYGELFLKAYGPTPMTKKLQLALAFRYEPPTEK